jgi:hypothetical protein
MAFSVSVTKRHIPKEFPSDGTQVDAWLAEEDKYLLYANAFGADSTVYDYWSLIAQQLNLRLLQSIYDNGLFIETKDDLLHLESELEIIKQYWENNFLHSDIQFYEVTDLDGKRTERELSLIEHLRQRYNYLKEAISIAIEHDALLDIS